MPRSYSLLDKQNKNKTILEESFTNNKLLEKNNPLYIYIYIQNNFLHKTELSHEKLV